jgi:hypothetical protein
MSNTQLNRRLQKISKPEKLACFLNVANSRREYSMVQDAIHRCNDLGFVAVEFRRGHWEVSPARPQDVTIGTAEQVPVRGPAGDSYVASLDALREALEDTGLSPSDEVLEEILENKEPKKKKSIYSRKLRTKRRK